MCANTQLYCGALKPLVKQNGYWCSPTAMTDYSTETLFTEKDFTHGLFAVSPTGTAAFYDSGWSKNEREYTDIYLEYNAYAFAVCFCHDHLKGF